MKKKIYLVLGLAVMLALIWNAAALSCAVESDCDSLEGVWDGTSPYQCVGQISYYNLTSYFCNASGLCEQTTSVPGIRKDCDAINYTNPTGTYVCCNSTMLCQKYWINYVCDAADGYCRTNTSAPKAHRNCGAHTVNGCLNGDLYLLDNVCEDAACKVNSSTLLNTSEPQCDYSADCAGDAHSLISPLSSVKYDITFDKSYARSSNGSVYYVAPGATMRMANISKITYLCGNSASDPETSSLAIWVYNATNNEKLAAAQNRIDIDDTLNRTNVIGDNSTIYGTPILNPFETVFDIWYKDYTKYNHVDDIYTFTAQHNYTVLVDLIAGYCGPNELKNTIDAAGKIIPANYICPWLGGSNRSDLCWKPGNYDARSEGWEPIDNITVVVINPDISIAAPPGEPSVNKANYSKDWGITNIGAGNVTMSIEPDCGGWACEFDGYAEGTQIPLEEGEQYTVTMNITTDIAQPIHQVGIIVTYDDGYGFTSISNKTKSSYIKFGAPIVT